MDLNLTQAINSFSVSNIFMSMDGLEETLEFSSVQELKKM